jgi:hypothetical protein
VKPESLIEAARSDSAVTPTRGARERVWNQLSHRRRPRATTALLFAVGAALGALLCLLAVRFVARPPAVSVVVHDGAVETVSRRHVRLAPGKAELTLSSGAEVELGERRVLVEVGVTELHVAADGSGMVRVDSGSCLLIDSQGERRLQAGASVSFGQPLSEEMVLYERAWALLAADPARALSAFDELLRRFPHGALAQEARLSKLEALDALKRPETGTEARAFLHDFPDSERAAEVHRLLKEK